MWQRSLNRTPASAPVAARRSPSRSRCGRSGRLAFYRSVGATRYIREGEALLAATA
jgi:hypothetical protein